MNVLYRLGLSLVCLVLITGSVFGQTTRIWPKTPADSLIAQFAGGLNGWTAKGVKATPADSAKNALWEFCPNGTFVNKGAYQGAGGIITSASRANGAAGFNSDYLDNRGVAGNFGNGPAGAPHRGELWLNQTIDCSSSTSVELKFNQALRQFNSSHIIDVSSDGGATWTTFKTNTEVGVNSAHINNVKYVNITSAAAGKKNVQIRFAIDENSLNASGSNYYYWIIDDIELNEVPDNDMRITAAHFPPNNYATPASQIAADTMDFLADIQNIGVKDQKNVVLLVTVQDTTSKNIVYRDSSIWTSVAVGLQSQVANGSFLEPTSDSSFIIQKRWAPGNLPAGIYRITYNIRSLDGVDARPTDNSRSFLFVVGAKGYTKENNTSLTNTRPASDATTYKFGGVYTTSPNWAANSRYGVENVYYVVSKFTADGPLNSGSSLLQVAELNSTVRNDYSNFDTKAEIGLDPAGQLLLVGLAESSFSSTKQDSAVLTTVKDLDDKDLELKKGTRYFFVTSYEGGTKLNFQFSRAFKNYNVGSSVAFINGSWTFVGFGWDYLPVMRVNVRLLTKTDETPLPDKVLNIYPNPAVDHVDAALNFDKPTNMAVVITNMNGSVLMMKDFDGVTTETKRFDVSAYPAGTYLMRIETSEGTKTKKFVVQK